MRRRTGEGRTLRARVLELAIDVVRDEAVIVERDLSSLAGHKRSEI